MQGIVPAIGSVVTVSRHRPWRTGCITAARSFEVRPPPVGPIWPWKGSYRTPSAPSATATDAIISTPAVISAARPSDLR